MPLATSLTSFSPFAPPAAAARATALPAQPLDAVAGEQARFRIEGSGPVSARTIVPASSGANQLLALNPGVTDAVRGVLRLVEQSAGGAAASASIPVNGISFSDSPQGLAATTWRAHAEDDSLFAASMAKIAQRDRPDALRRFTADLNRESQTTQANVVAGWVNVGPTASGALLRTAGITFPGFNDALRDADLGLAVRVLRHEAAHLADPTNPRLSKDGAMALREALAETHSNSVESLQRARQTLGLDGVVSDAALQSSLTMRPYAAAEQVLAGALRLGGLDPAGAEASALVARPSDEVAETLVTRLATATGSSAEQARASLGEELGRVLGRHVS